ncbi:DUF6214 family protein [Streptomyces sp. 891-h]|uniref:DUF6214 family protein n=1 Tax=Streptomyces sp. 891-h TaxID=2720714 RepID=UPI0020699FCF|nr:hypothetical protein HC362_02730 [Streptomyces sp. 891-h]
MSDHSYEWDGGPPDRASSSPPRTAWKLRGYGTGAGPPHGVGARPPWYAVGVRRADGTQVEVVAAVVDGRVRLEEVRADPPLTSQEFAQLAPCLGEPLARACPPAIRPPEAAPTVRATGACVLRPGRLPAAQRPAPSQPLVASVPSVVAEPPAAPRSPAPAHRAPQPPSRPQTPAAAPPVTPPSAPVRCWRRPPGPRGRDALRAAADAYTAARQRGQDPVLAVMRLTGRSRRKSLRVIARARDAGLLSPRHARR